MTRPHFRKRPVEGCDVGCNLLVAVVTASHEWGNLLGYLSLPLAIALAIHLLYVLIGEGERL